MSILKKLILREYKHPNERNLNIPDTEIKVDKKALLVRKQQPKLGEHNEEILAELGYSFEEIEKIYKKMMNKNKYYFSLQLCN